MNKYFAGMALTLSSASLDVWAAENDIVVTGQQQYEALCETCHDDTSQGTERVAPPMLAIKNQYLNTSISESEFIQNMVNYVLNPSEQNSKMPDAINRFGLMPNMAYSKTQIEPIASYVFHAELNKPNQPVEQTASTLQPKSNLETAKQMALSAKAVLGKNLLSAIQNKGTIGALGFCNENAIPLTDAVAEKNNVKIKRVSDLNRNPDNKANADELAYITATKSKLQAKQAVAGSISETPDKVIAYFPITTNPMCLQCHGKISKDIDPDTYTQIKALYPNDLATGYESDQLRGIWVIEMNKQQNNEPE